MASPFSFPLLFFLWTASQRCLCSLYPCATPSRNLRSPTPPHCTCNVDLAVHWLQRIRPHITSKHPLPTHTHTHTETHTLQPPLCSSPLSPVIINPRLRWVAESRSWPRATQGSGSRVRTALIRQRRRREGLDRRWSGIVMRGLYCTRCFWVLIKY